MSLLDKLDCWVYEVLFITFLCVYSILLVWSCWIRVIILCVVYVCLQKIRRWKRKLLESQNRAVLITGCDTGFGHYIAKRLDDQDFIVFAGVLSSSSEGAEALRARNSKRMKVIQLDVTNQEDVDNAEQVIKSACGNTGLWGVVNNAGINIFCDVEFATVEQYKKCLDVNLYGMIRVTKACLPYIRQAKGRVVNISSVRGRFPWPSDSIYHVSKYGVETMSDSLRLEMRKFGVNVAIIQPGSFGWATSCCSPEQVKRLTKELETCWKKASEDVKDTYGREHIDHTLSLMNPLEAPVHTADPVLEAVEDALLNVNPRPRYLVYGHSKYYIDHHALLAQFYDFLPTWLSDRILVGLTDCDTIHKDTSLKRD